MKNCIRDNRLAALFFILVFIILQAACTGASEKSVPVKTNEPTDLNAIITELPDAPGHEAFKMNCISCHSARYVQMQPDFSEKTWTTIVGKMQKSFGAPVTDSSAKEIVKYLVAIKGKK